MPTSSDGTLRLPRPEPVAYDDTEMEDVAACPSDLTWQDEVDYLRKVYKETTDDK